MLTVVKIDDEEISAESFVKLLKVNDKLDALLESVVTDKLTVHAAKKSGMEISAEELQARADDIRRIEGLHRAQDTMEYLNNLGLSVEEFEQHVVESLYREKMEAQICTEEAVNEYFRLHSPSFDSVEVSHILLDSEGKASEVFALLEEDPDSFADMAMEHSLAEDTRYQGGSIGKVLRGTLHNEIEAKVFNALERQPLGPFRSEDGRSFEIFMVDSKIPASLKTKTLKDVKKKVFRKWLEDRVGEFRIEVY